MTDVKKCKEQVRGEGQWGSFHRHQCRNNAIRDGYCGIHHPDAVKCRREKTDARHEKQFREQRKKRDRAAFDKREGDRCRKLGIQPEEIEKP